MDEDRIKLLQQLAGIQTEDALIHRVLDRVCESDLTALSKLASDAVVRQLSMPDSWNIQSAIEARIASLVRTAVENQLPAFEAAITSAVAKTLTENVDRMASEITQRTVFDLIRRR